MQEPVGSKERERNINPSQSPTELRIGSGEGQVTGGTSEEDSKTESERTQVGQESRKAVRPKSLTGNQTQVKKEGSNVPSVASQIIGTLTSPFGYIGEEGWKGIAGIARTLGADSVAEYAANTAAQSVEDWATTFKGTPQKEGVGKTIGQVGAFALEAPLMFTGAGMAGFLAQGYGGMKEGLRDKYLQEGLSEEDANKKSTTHAALSTVAAIPAYILAGKVAGKAADKLFAEASPKLLELATRFGMNGAANMVASSVARGFGAGLEGEDIGAAMKDVSLSGVLQDFAFAGHSTGEWFHNSLNKAQAARELPDDMLKYTSENSKNRDERVAAKGEIKRREAEGQAKAAKENDLPETSKVVEKPQEVPPEKTEEKPPSEEPLVEGVEPAKVPPTEELIAPADQTHTHASEPTGTQKPIEGTRITAAAWRDPRTGEIHEGASHQEAMENGKAKPIEDPAARETKDFGFMTDKGEFISREDAQPIAEKSGQFLGKNTDRPVMHSNEVSLDHHQPEKPGHINGAKLIGRTAKDALKILQEHPNSNAALRKFAKILSNFVGDKKLEKDLFKWVPKELTEDQKKAEAWRDQATNSIHIKRGDVPLGTVVHEIFHTLTQNEINKYVGHFKGVSGYRYLKELNKALADKNTPEPVKRIINLYKVMLNRKGLFEKYLGEGGLANHPDINIHETYGFADLHEFISEAFTSRAFQKMLKETEGDGQKSLWQNLLDAVSKLFKAPKGSMLESVMDASLGVAKIGRPEEVVPKAAAKISPEAGQELLQIQQDLPSGQSLQAQAARHSLGERVGMFQDDMKAMGVKGAAENIKESGKGLFSGLRDAMVMAGDVLQGKTIPQLTKAGVKLSATQLAHAKRMLDPYVKHLIAEVFPDGYKISEAGRKEIEGIESQLDKALREQKRLAKYGDDKLSKLELGKKTAEIDGRVAGLERELDAAKNKHDPTRATMDIINKDNILGGADILKEELEKHTKELEDLKGQWEAGLGGSRIKSEIANLEERVAGVKDALSAIEKVHNLEKYAEEVEAAKGTKIEENINRWKSIINEKMDELYKKVNATDKTPESERGRVFGARVNLLAKWADRDFKKYEDDERGGQEPPVMTVDYRNPDIKDDMLKKRAAFNSIYTNDVEAILKNSFGARINEASKMHFYEDLVKNEVAQWEDEGGDGSPIKGEKARRMSVEWPVRDEKGRFRREKRNLYIQDKLYNEISSLLEISKRHDQIPILSEITKFQIFGIADATSHLKNLLGVVTYSLGRDSIMKDIVSKIPIVGSINALAEIRSVVKEIHSDSKKIRKELAELASTSGTRPHYKQTGVSSVLGFMHDVIHEADVASRIIMSRRYKQLVDRGWAKPGEANKIDFINQIGEYNHRLMNRHESFLRDVGISPFIVAGRAMNRMARRVVLGSTGFEAVDFKTQAQIRALQVSGLVMAALIPALINLFTTGSMMGRKGTPVGAIDFGPNFDTSDGKKRTFDLFQLVGIRRGLRQLGLNAAIEGVKNGDSWRNIQENALNDAKTTSLHPFIGPGIGLGYETVTGKRLDLRSGFQDMYTSRKVGGYAQYVENFRTGIKQQNELLYSGSGLGYAIEKGMEAAGIPRPVEQNEAETLRDIGFPTDIPVISQVGKSLYTAAGTVIGAAGGKLNVSPAMKLSAQLGSKQQYDPQQDIRYKYRQEILRAVKAGNKEEAQRIYQEGIAKNVLTKADDKTLKGQIKQPNILLQRVGRLKTPEDALSVFRVATAEEQDQIFNTVFKKIKGASAVSPETKQKMFKEFGKVAKRGTKLYNLVNQ
jgi:hypothetical protein